MTSTRPVHRSRLHRLFDPTSIAVVGASSSPSKLGSVMLDAVSRSSGDHPNGLWDQRQIPRRVIPSLTACRHRGPRPCTRPCGVVRARRRHPRRRAGRRRLRRRRSRYLLGRVRRGRRGGSGPTRATRRDQLHNWYSATWTEHLRFLPADRRDGELRPDCRTHRGRPRRRRCRKRRNEPCVVIPAVGVRRGCRTRCGPW